jgi:hypothetical protein
MPVHPEIYRVVSLQDGTAMLELPDGRKSSEHVSRLAPCKLPPAAEVAPAEPDAGATSPPAPPWPAPAPPGPDGKLFPNKLQRARDAEAKTYHGRVIRKFYFVPGNATRRGKKQPFYGRVHFLGDRERPWYFGISYADKDRETMDLKQLKETLLTPQEEAAISPSLIPPLGSYAALAFFHAPA